MRKTIGAFLLSLLIAAPCFAGSVGNGGIFVNGVQQKAGPVKKVVGDSVSGLGIDGQGDGTNDVTITNSGLNITSGKHLMIGSTQLDNGSDKIDGEQIADDTIDDDSIDLTDVTLADFTNDAGYLTANQTITLSGDVTGSGTTSITTTISSDSVDDTMIDWGTGTGQVSADDVTEGTTHLFLTSAERTILGNTSGTNTGDQDLSGYLLATGATTGATSQAQTFTNGVITPKIYPSADSTTAIQINKADGTTNVLNVDTTNGRVGIGESYPRTTLHVKSGSSGASSWDTGSLFFLEGDESHKFLTFVHPDSTSDYVGFSWANDSDSYIANIGYKHSDNTFRIYSNNATRLTISNIGYIGIGTSSPVAALDIKRNITSSSGVGYGIRGMQTITAAANNDVLEGLRINTTFSDGAYTGVTHNLLDLLNASVSKFSVDGSGNASAVGTVSGLVISSPQLYNAGDITIDAYNAAADSTVTITNSDGTYDANLSVDGDLIVKNISVQDGGVLQLGYDTVDGELRIYSEQGGTDYIAHLFANTAMTSAANFYLPADEPASTQFLTMTSGGAIGFDTLGFGALADPDANTILGWDDTDGAMKTLTIGAGLSYDHATHTISSTAGTTALDDIGDPDAATSISTDDGENLTFLTAVDGENFLAIHQTAADVTASTYLLDLGYNADADTEADFILCRDDLDGTPAEMFKVEYNGDTTTAGNINAAGLYTSSINNGTSSNDITIDASGDDVWVVGGTNLQMGNATTDAGSIYMRNGAVGGDPLVTLSMSTNDFVVTTDTGDINLVPAGGEVNVTGAVVVDAAGVKISSDGDGAITFLGLGDGYDEDLTINLDDTENTAVISSSTGVTKIDAGNIIFEGKFDSSDGTAGASATTGGLTFKDGLYTSGTATEYATKALDNLASVAINTSLVSDTDNTDDLGTSAKAWKDLYLKGKIYGGNNDGWSPAEETWTYASASSFTVSGVDVTAKYSKGTRLKFVQSAATKYAVVVSSSFSTNTTVNILVNTDYTIANDTISGNYYSYQMNPQGYPGWFAIAAPTFTGIDNGSGGQPTVSEHRGRVDGNVYKSHFHIGNTAYKDGATNYFSWTGAVACANSTARSVIGSSYWNTAADASYVGAVMNTTSTTFYSLINSNDALADNTQFGHIGIDLQYEI